MNKKIKIFNKIIIIVSIFFMNIVYADIYFIKTKINNIDFFKENEKDIKIKKIKEIVKTNSTGNKDGDLYIELEDKAIIKGQYTNGLLNGKLEIEQSNKKIKEIYNYKNNMKNGEYLLTAIDGDYLYKIYKNDVEEGKSEFKFEKLKGYQHYLNGKKHGDQYLEFNDGLKTYINYIEDNPVGEIKVIYPDGAVKKFIENNTYNGQVEVILPNKDIVYMTFIEDIQVGNIVVFENEKKHIYKDMDDFIDNYGENIIYLIILE